jgi:hypothetical protein
LFQYERVNRFIVIFRHLAVVHSIFGMEEILIFAILFSSSFGYFWQVSGLDITEFFGVGFSTSFGHVPFRFREGLSKFFLFRMALVFANHADEELKFGKINQTPDPS